MPPAFVLSQDQTLRKIKLFYRKIRFKALNLRLCVSSLVNFQGLHRTIQFSISSLTSGEWHRLNISHFFNFASGFLKIFEIFYFSVFKRAQKFLWSISLAASSFSTRNRNIIYHSFLTLQAIFWNFFDFLFSTGRFQKVSLRVVYQPCVMPSSGATEA